MRAPRALRDSRLDTQKVVTLLGLSGFPNDIFRPFGVFRGVISWERPCGSSWKTRSVFQGAVGAFCASTAPSASTGPVRGRQDGSQGGEPGVMSNWTAASSDCGRDDVHIRTADLYRPNARFTPERQRYQVLTPFGKLGYSHFILISVLKVDAGESTPSSHVVSATRCTGKECVRCLPASNHLGPTLTTCEAGETRQEAYARLLEAFLCRLLEPIWLRSRAVQA